MATLNSFATSARRSQPVSTLIVVVLCVVNLVAAIVTCMALLERREDYEEKAELTTHRLTDLIDGNITSNVEKIDLSLQSIVGQIEQALRDDRKLNPDRIEALLAVYQQRLGGLTVFRVSDSAGDVIHGDGAARSPRINLADRAYFLRQRSTNAGLTVADPVFGRIQKAWQVPFVRRYEYPDGRFGGVVVGSVRLDYFAKLLTNLDLGPQGIAVLRDASLGLISRNPPLAGPLGELGSKGFSPEVGEAAAQGVLQRTFRSDRGADGVPRTLTYRHLSALPFHLTIGLGQDDYLSDWYHELTGALAGLALFVAATSALGWLLWRAVNETRREQSRSEALLRGASDGIHILDRDGTLLEASDSFCTMLGYDRPDLLGSNVATWDAQYSAEQLRSNVAARFEDPTPFTIETRHRRKDGSTLDVEIAGYLLDFDGSPVLFNSSRDITQRKQAEARLKLAASVFSQSREGIMITDAEANIIEVNEAFSRITGYCREEAINQNPRMLQSGRHGQGFYAAMWQAITENGYWSGDIWNRNKAGKIYPAIMNISAVRDSTGRTHNYVALFSDITPIKEEQQRLEYRAHYDTLTNLPNRVLLADRLQHAMAHSLRRGLSLAVVYLDLDGFKAVNDQHGHETGDQLLITVAHRLKAALREGDTLARIGGDEFVAVLVDLEQAQDCEPVLGRLLQAAAQAVTLGGHQLQISASIGVTIFPQDGAHADVLMRHADQAMYEAKQAGKNRYHLFDTRLEQRLESRHIMLSRINTAIAENELCLYYQPKVDCHLGEVVGFEALIRWNNPTLGLLGPAEFLPVVGDDELGLVIGRWVQQTALRQLTSWHEEGVLLCISINAFLRQLLAPNFLADLGADLAANPYIRSDQLQIEIIETSALRSTDAIRGLIEAGQAMGIGFSLDDFGTAASSLAYLRNLPAREIKIDATFIRNMLARSEDLAIVEAAIRLAHAFGRSSVAVGVEEQAQILRLLSMGCHLMQGYALAPPMPASQVLPWLRQFQPRPEWSGAAIVGSLETAS